MSRRVLRPSGDICQLCDFLLVRQPLLKKSIRPRKLPISTRTFSTTTRSYGTDFWKEDVAAISQRINEPPIKPNIGPFKAKNEILERIAGNHATEAELDNALLQVKTTCRELLALDRVPSEQETLQVLSQCEAMAKLLVLEPPCPHRKKQNGATSALLSLDDSPSKRTTPYPVNIQRMIDELSRVAYSVVEFPPVFITPTVLDLYVKVQATLGTPRSLPAVLYLYGNKPLAQEKTYPIRYSESNPYKVANSIPQLVADRALQAAIDAKELVAAMDIINVSFTTTAFRRAKFVRKGLLPATALTVAPVAVYSLASQLALLQTTMDTAMATKVAFVGMLAYLGFTTTIGIVAVTTANDQMIRVTWAPGVPLRERWMREEERAAIDKVAVAWGFREVWRRGEEEGEDWDLLREWIGGNAMMLDRVELMEGME